MGNEYGDAQNSAVRVFLYQFSKKFDTFFNNYYRQKTLDYFDNKCPYSGVDISNIKTDNDHVIPFNKEHCGLHVYGNILIVTKEANSKKHNQTLENFLNDNPERLAKIQKFMQESLFKSIYETYNEQLKLNCRSIYEEIRVLIENRFTNFVNIINLQDTSKNIPQKTILNNNLYSVKNNKYDNYTKQHAYIVAYCFSNYDHSSIYPYINQTEAFLKASQILGIKKNSLKTFRDYFDANNNNHRRGFWQNPLPPSMKEIKEIYDKKSKQEVISETKRILNLTD